MGPSWYWMPDIFEGFFNDFGYSVKDFYPLKLLHPAFDIIFENNDLMSIPENYHDLRLLFESIERGAALQLDKFMEEAKYKYEIGMKSFAHMPGISITEFADFRLLQRAVRLKSVFPLSAGHIRKYFSHPKLIALMEFPVLFLGATPQNTPALYSLMNYAGTKLGTWYPEGGFGKVVSSIQELAISIGVEFHFNSLVDKIVVDRNKVTGLIVHGITLPYDAVLATADYHYVEKCLLPNEFSNYDEKYWEKKTFAPSCLIFISVSQNV